MIPRRVSRDWFHRCPSNPARIIPAWARFVAESGELGGAMRGIGEPVWVDRRRW